MNARANADTANAASRRTARALNRRLTRLLAGHSPVGALLSGMQRGFHKQLLLAWVLVLSLPALIAALPVTTWLHAQFGRSPSATAIAEGREPAAFLDAFQALGYAAPLLGGSTVFAVLLALALSPWLAGMIIAQIRTVYRLRTGGVLRAGLGEYPRMLRMLLWSIVPLGIAAVLGALALWAAETYAGDVVLARQADTARRAASLVCVVLLVLAHVTVEAGRAWLGADLALTSVVEAWKRGVTMLARRPAAVLVVYLGTTVAGLMLGAVFIRLRLLLDPSGWMGWLLALACTELAVAAVAWSRSARLHGLADLATGIVMAQEESALAQEQDAPGRASKSRTSAG